MVRPPLLAVGGGASPHRPPPAAPQAYPGVQAATPPHQLLPVTFQLLGIHASCTHTPSPTRPAPLHEPQTQLTQSPSPDTSDSSPVAPEACTAPSSACSYRNSAASCASSPVLHQLLVRRQDRGRVQRRRRCWREGGGWRRWRRWEDGRRALRRSLVPLRESEDGGELGVRERVELETHWLDWPARRQLSEFKRPIQSFVGAESWTRERGGRRTQPRRRTALRPRRLSSRGLSPSALVYERLSRDLKHCSERAMANTSRPVKQR